MSFKPKFLNSFPGPARKWFVLCFLPLLCTIAGLILFALSALIDALAGPHPSNGVHVVSGVVSILGAVSFVIAFINLLFLDMWIILFAKALRYNPADHTWNLSKTAALIFAAIFGFWAWIYTYERDKWKFWVNLVLFIVTLTLWSLVGWVWVIIDLARKPRSYFEQFPSGQVSPPASIEPATP